MQKITEVTEVVLSKVARQQSHTLENMLLACLTKTKRGFKLMNEPIYVIPHLQTV
jgi:hypothetical protein